MPIGGFRYSIEPRKAVVGEKVTFIAEEFNTSLYGYEVTYEVLPTPISSRLTWNLRIKAERNPISLPAAGYSGPKVVFDSLRAGFYRVEFDSASDFRHPLGDSATFEVGIAPMGIRSGNRNGDPGREAGNGMFFRWRQDDRRLDGRLDKRPPETR